MISLGPKSLCEQETTLAGQLAEVDSRGGVGKQTSVQPHDATIFLKRHTRQLLTQHSVSTRNPVMLQMLPKA